MCWFRVPKVKEESYQVRAQGSQLGTHFHVSYSVCATGR
jgi:hypothetical protein